MDMLKTHVRIALAAVILLAPMQEVIAQGYRTDTGGNGYIESQRSPSIAAGVALALIGLTAIIAVAVQNQGGNGHSHDSSCSH